MELLLRNANGRIRGDRPLTGRFKVALEPGLVGSVFGMASNSTENSEEPVTGLFAVLSGIEFKVDFFRPAPACASHAPSQPHGPSERIAFRIRRGANGG